MPPPGDNVAADGVQSMQPVVASPYAQRRAAMLKAVQEGSRPSGVYWLMNALSAVIACYGLFANSPAVVIGSMVVAMLLGPIAGVALGLNEKNLHLLRTALVSLAGGIAWILAIATLVGIVHRHVPLTAEILARTRPNLFDLIIALAGGAAGAVAVLSPQLATAIVGVAVATALVPPVAAAGILLARTDFVLAHGALLLATTNVVAIQVAFSVVFWFGGYRELTALGWQGILAFLRRDLPSVAIVCILAIVLGVQLHRATSTSLFESQVQAVLRKNFSESSGYHIVDVRRAQEADGPVVTAVIRGPSAPSTAAVATAQAALPRLPEASMPRLRIRFIEVVIVTPQGAGGGDDEIEQ